MPAPQSSTHDESQQTLVLRQHGTGGKVRLLGISKRGDWYLRTFCDILQRERGCSPWRTHHTIIGYVSI